MSDERPNGVDPRFDPAFQRGFDPSIPIEEYVPPRQTRKPAVPSPPAAQTPARAAWAGAAAPVASPAAPVSPAPGVPAATGAVARSTTGSVSGPAASNLAPATYSSATAALAASLGVELSDDEADAPVSGADEAADQSPSRNPFLLFLGIIAIALIAAGIWLFVRSGEAFNSKEVRSQGDYMSLDATIHMAPFIALLGAATAIGILFFFASRYRRR